MKNDGLSIKDAIVRARSGEHLLIVCKSRYEAEKSAKALHLHTGLLGGSLTGCNLQICEGSIEFGWVETSSSRRLDDFADASFEITDAFRGERFPGSTVEVRKFSLDEIAQ